MKESNCISPKLRNKITGNSRSKYCTLRYCTAATPTQSYWGFWMGWDIIILCFVLARATSLAVWTAESLELKPKIRNRTRCITLYTNPVLWLFFCKMRNPVTPGYRGSWFLTTWMNLGLAHNLTLCAHPLFSISFITCISKFSSGKLFCKVITAETTSTSYSRGKILALKRKINKFYFAPVPRPHASSYNLLTCESCFSHLA